MSHCNEPFGDTDEYSYRSTDASTDPRRRVQQETEPDPQSDTRESGDQEQPQTSAFDDDDDEDEDMEGEEDPATQTSTTTGEGQHHHHHPTQGHITVPSHDDDDASRGAGTGLENVERGRDTSGSTSFPATTTSYSHDDSFTTRDGYAGVPAGVGVGGGSGRFGDDDSDERGREGRKGDSTLGKLVEKTGSAVGSAMLVEKGREKREQKGAGEGEDGGHAN